MKKIAIQILLMAMVWHEGMCQHVPNHIPIPINPQRRVYHFDYDLNGNRVKKYTIFNLCQTDDAAKMEDEKPPIEKHRSDLDKMGIKLFPNPTTDVVHVTVNSDEEIEELSVWLSDLSGKEFFRKNNIPNKVIEPIPLGHLMSGVYLIHVQVNGKKYVWEVIKSE